MAQIVAIADFVAFWENPKPVSFAVPVAFDSSVGIVPGAMPAAIVPVFDGSVAMPRKAVAFPVTVSDDAAVVQPFLPVKEAFSVHGEKAAMGC